MAEQVLKNTSVFLLRTEMAADSVVSGVVNRISHGGVVPFIGLDQALLMINEWLEEEKPLSADAALRTFETGRRRKRAVYAGADRVERIDSNDECLAGLGRRGDARRREAFLVRIICREHNSWQGEICWKSQRLYFRSTLELMCLIHSALNPGAAIPESAAGVVVRSVFRVV